MSPGSAVSNTVLSVQQILRQTGYYSEIYARSWQPGVPPQRHAVCHTERTLWLYHFSVGSPLSRWVERRARRDRVLLWYHNLTPPAYFNTTDPALAERLAAGRSNCGGWLACARALSPIPSITLPIYASWDIQNEIVPPVFLDARYRLSPSPESWSAIGTASRTGSLWGGWCPTRDRAR